MPAPCLRQGNKWLVLLLAGAMFSNSARAAATDCIQQAARCFHVNPLIIQAIIWQESGGHQQARQRNSNHTEDVGVMQINSIHFPLLRTMGITEQELRKNSCINTFFGTYLLHQAINKHGYSWEGIGNYHSNTPVYHDRYLVKLLKGIRKEITKIEGIKIHGRSEENVKKRFVDYCVNP